MLNSSNTVRFFMRIPFTLQTLLLIVTGMAVLMLRNSDPLMNPIIYTEDGSWVGLALTKGWLHAFIYAKEGYFVWGNILLLAASVGASNVICGNFLTCLPQAIALWSYFFFAGVATLAWFVTKGILPTYSRWVLYFFVLLLPLGDSSNEIIGRISNIGYYCVFLTLILMFWKVHRMGHQVAIDLALLLCAATNPISLILIPILAGFSLWLQPDSPRPTLKDLFRKYAFIFGCVIVLMIFIVIRASDVKGSSITGSLQLENLIEVALARSLLYPFVFPIYNMLSDTTVVILATTLFAAFVYLWRTQHDRNVRMLVAMSIVALFIYLLSTMYMRQSLTQQLGGYRTTFPDRYFMGLNVLAVFTMVILAGSHTTLPIFRRFVGQGLIFIFIAIYFMNLDWILEREDVRMKIATGPTFKEQLCLSGIKANRSEDSIVSLPTYFQGWSMAVPAPILGKAIQRLDCTKDWSNVFLTDANWDHGIARRWAGFIIPNTQEFASQYQVGKEIKFAHGESREVIRVDSNGQYLNIFVSGDPLNPEKVGLPTTFIVMERIGSDLKEDKK